jgi:DNA-binding transcriptional MerR regulator
MNNSFSQMAFNFGAETPPPPVPLEGENREIGGYAVGQENGYSGVRVRIKSLKNAAEPPVLAGESRLPAVEAGNDETTTLPVGVADAEPMDESPADKLAAETTIPAAVINVPAEVVTGNEAAGSRDNDSSLSNGPLSNSSRGKNDSRGETNSRGKPAKSKRGRKSLKQATAEADLIEIPGDDILFSKQYYTMRAVAEMFRVNQSLLRFWEAEFDILQPRKNKKGDRYFRPIDIKHLHLIYHLLRQRKYTIEGAKEFLKKNKKAEERFEAIQRLQQLKAFLLEWKAQL